MSTVKYTCLFLTFLSISFLLESREFLDEKKINNIQPAQDLIYLQFADIFDSIGDLPSSATTINQLIARKEFNECYDDHYVQALYKVQNIYALIDINMAIEINKKIQIHDKNLPNIKIENGMLTAEKFTIELDDEMQLFMKEIIFQSKMCESFEDIEFSEGKMKIKLKPCCCCSRPDA